MRRQRTTFAVLVAWGTIAVAMTSCENARPGASGLFDALRPTSPLEAAQMALDPYDAERRSEGTLLLANASFAGEKVYMDLFKQRLGDQDASVRAAAVRAIANHGQPEDAAVLAAQLVDEDVLVRREVAKGLQRLHSPAVIEPLINRLLDRTNETDTLVRAEIAEALGQYSDPRVLDALVVSLDDPQLAVNRNSVRSLRTLTGQDFGFSRREWSRWVSGATSPFAAQAVYVYPAFQRPKHWWEFIPFWPQPTLEAPGVPTGFPIPGRV